MSDKSNTAVHEFSHLLDMADGATDGIPELLLPAEFLKPWTELIREEIEAIQEKNSDINPYGATSETEFFAVASEYFFERPELLEQKHPELYALMLKAFQRKPVLKTADNKSDVGRNDDCPCGSGEKYKLCHGRHR